MVNFYVSKVRLSLIVVLVSLLTESSAQTFTPITARITKHIGGYWEYLPRGYDSSSAKKYPLLLYFHGIGEIGTGSRADLNKLLKNDIPKSIVRHVFPDSFFVNKDTFQFVIICPQLSVSGRSWGELNQFLDTVISKYNIDQTRLYITGLSYGGGTVMYYLADSSVGAKRMAAVAVASQNLVLRTSYIQNLSPSALPMWFVANRYDTIVPSSTTVNWVSNLDSVASFSPKPLLDMFNKKGHDAWTQMYNPTWRPRGMNIYEWMLQYKRSLDSLYPVINAPDSVYLPADSIFLNGTSSRADQNATITDYNWRVINGPRGYVLNSSSTYVATLSHLQPGTYTIELLLRSNFGAIFSTQKNIVVIKENSPPVAVITGDTATSLPADSIRLSGSGSHDGDGHVVSYLWKYVSGPLGYTLSDATNADIIINNLNPGTYSFSLTVTDNRDGSASDTVYVYVHPRKPPVPPIPVIHGDTLVVLPVDSTVLNASASYDTVNTITSYNWSYISGPEEYLASNPASPIFHIQNLTKGQYVFSLTISNDDGGIAIDTFTFKVRPKDLLPQKPVVVIKGDSLVTLPADSARLNGEFSYDLNGNIKEYLWKFVSGPSRVNIADSISPVITLYNLDPGDYLISLTVINDIGFIATDTFSFGVAGQRAYPGNPPRALIITDSIIILPNNALVLNGKYSYASEDSIVSYKWECISGRTGFSISDTASSAPHVSNLREGVYVFKLTVYNSKGASGADSIKVIVLRRQSSGNLLLPPLQIVTKPGLTLAPVPTRTYLDIYLNDSTTGKLSFRVLDMNGRVVALKNNSAKTTANWKTTISVANLAEGSYFLEVLIENKYFKGRFIKL